ncbi:hypothetical protein VQ044_24235 [Aurantimonas sp. C2-5-R2]|uniref:hypothetical protein n=1 Tax=Aurantimonas sp. C2-5-R2 TaxID=3113713 RepID=UPI002F938BA9
MSDKKSDNGGSVLGREIIDPEGGDVCGAIERTPLPTIERDGELRFGPSMVQYRLRKHISEATMGAIQDYLMAFGTGRADIHIINGTVFLRPRTKSDADLLESEMPSLVVGWKAER